MTDSIIDLIDGAIEANGDAMRWTPEPDKVKPVGQTQYWVDETYIVVDELVWCMNGTGRHLVENCARIAEGSTDGPD